MDPPAAPRPTSSCGSDADDHDGWEVISSHSHCNDTPSPRRHLINKSKAQDGFEVAAWSGSTSSSTATVQQRQQAQEPIMPGWKDDYLSSILEAERSNPVNFDLVEACTLAFFPFPF